MSQEQLTEMNMATITIKLEVTDQHCADILCTALEGGIGYWAQARKIVYGVGAPDDYKPISRCEIAELNDDESGYDWKHPHALDYAVIRKGIERLFENPKYVGLASGIMKDIVNDEMGCYIDANVADVIVQFGLFNEERYA